MTRLTPYYYYYYYYYGAPHAQLFRGELRLGVVYL